MKKRLKSYRFGVKAEKWVIWWLRLQGYMILQHRYKTPVGEIDIIAKRFSRLRFIEVKARSIVTDKRQKTKEIISEKQMNRIKRAALYWIKQKKLNDDLVYSFDLVIVSHCNRWRFPSISIIEQAWSD